MANIKEFFITTERNDTVKFDNIFNDTEDCSTEYYSLKRNGDEFVDLGLVQEINYDCYSTEDYIPDKNIMCSYTNKSFCRGFHRVDVHIMLECSIMKRSFVRTGPAEHLVEYFSTAKVKLNLLERQ